MPIDRMTRADLVANITQSQGHIAKQEAIIVRLGSQGHLKILSEAQALLKTMHVHLDTEIEMLSQMAD